MGNRRGKKHLCFSVEFEHESLHSKVAFCFCCVPLCCERYQPTQGQSAAAFCSLCKEISQIPEMNTCAGVELHRWFKTHNQICTQKHTRDLQTQYTQCAWKNTVSTTHFICWAGTVWHILEIIFLINTPQELYYGGFFVNSSGSRSRTQNEIYGHAVKKMSALFYFITQFDSFPTVWAIW